MMISTDLYWFLVSPFIVLAMMIALGTWVLVGWMIFLITKAAK